MFIFQDNKEKLYACNEINFEVDFVKICNDALFQNKLSGIFDICEFMFFISWTYDANCVNSTCFAGYGPH